MLEIVPGEAVSGIRKASPERQIRGESRDHDPSF
jgi:hypothetical protein